MSATALYDAIKNHHDLTALERELYYGADADFWGHSEKTPLHWAAEWCNPKAVSLLISWGADMNETNIYGQTPLHTAAEYDDSLQIMPLLLDAGSVIEARDDDGLTPLHRAVKMNKPRAVKFLVDRGADIGVTDYKGNSLLDIAYSKTVIDKDILRMLEQRLSSQAARDVLVGSGGPPAPPRNTREASTRGHITAAASASECQDHYPMTHVPRGYALIFNMMNFSHRRDVRQGSDVDVQNLTKLFFDLKFTVKRYTDMKKRDLIETLDDVTCNQKLRRHDAFIVCLMSHGQQGHISTSDGQQVLINDVIAKFNNMNCPKLIGKPKIFFIQACRGGTDDYGVHMPSDADPMGYVPRVGSDADALVCYATSQDYVSYRNPTRGAWFIQALVDTFRQHHSNKHLLELMTIVNHSISQYAAGYIQTPEQVNRLRKLLYL